MNVCRLLAICLALAAVLTAAPVSARADKAVEIATVEDFCAMAEAPEGSYILTANLDFAGHSHIPFAFSGNLDGNGYMLLNLDVTAVGEETGITFDGNDIEYDTVYAGLFSTLENAVVQNLTLVNSRVEIETAENCFAACLAGSMTGTSIENVQVVNGYVHLEQTAYQYGVAGLVGFGDGTFRNCGFEGTLIEADTNREENSEGFLGGIAATGMFDLERCTVTLDAYAAVCGYAHSGGLVGMFYDPAWEHTGLVDGCTVSGRILFYEYNPDDRRAYCEAFVGEELGDMELSDNLDAGFVGEEADTTEGILLPEQHEDTPDYDAVVTDPTCTQCGYTTYTCTDPDCGYSYRDEYTLPVHVPGEPVTVLEPTYDTEGQANIYCAICETLIGREILPVHVQGEWIMTKAPTYEEEGVMTLYCSQCGALLETQAVERLTYARSCVLDREELTLLYRGYDTLTATLEPDHTALQDVLWSSSDTEVVTVDSQGNLAAVGRGTAVITCYSADGATEATCKVTVAFSWWQWIIWTVLFGFLWY